jgi:hypothetical protein
MLLQMDELLRWLNFYSHLQVLGSGQALVTLAVIWRTGPGHFWLQNPYVTIIQRSSLLSQPSLNFHPSSLEILCVLG